LKGKDNFENMGVDIKILQWILEKRQGERLLVGFIWLRIGICV
jgi:hypothetical protein